MKNKFINTLLIIILTLIVFLLSIMVYRELKPKTHSEKEMECLRLNSEFAQMRCITQLH